MTKSNRQCILTVHVFCNEILLYLSVGKENPLLILFADFLFKFLVIGNAGTGKSCLLHQFIEKRCKVSLEAFAMPSKSLQAQCLYIPTVHVFITLSLLCFGQFIIHHESV